MSHTATSFQLHETCRAITRAWAARHAPTYYYFCQHVNTCCPFHNALPLNTHTVGRASPARPSPAHDHDHQPAEESYRHPANNPWQQRPQEREADIQGDDRAEQQQTRMEDRVKWPTDRERRFLITHSVSPLLPLRGGVARHRVATN